MLSLLLAATLLWTGPHCENLACLYGTQSHPPGAAPASAPGAAQHDEPPPDLMACPDGAQLCATSLVLVPRVATRDVVGMALASIEMPLPVPHAAPAPRTWVNLETRLWIQRGLWRTYHGEASFAGQRVELNGRPVQVVWDLGDGRETCASTECAHTWRRSSTTPYEVTATVEYLVDWSCTGSCDERAGTLGPLSATGRTRERVGEIQTSAVS
ncbi:MAG: hypothetical protein ABIS86_04840 [Streptosporangiaceae bacterium]